VRRLLSRRVRRAAGAATFDVSIGGFDSTIRSAPRIFGPPSIPMLRIFIVTASVSATADFG